MCLSISEFWLLSTGLPLVSATFGPVANLLSICALVETWRVSASNDDDRVSDPPWALAINAVSLAFGIAANISLLLTFLRRVPYRFSQPFTVVAWFLSAALLIVLLIAYARSPDIKPQKGIVWSQSYYYAIISAALYFSICLMLAFNLWGAYVRAHYPPGLPGLTAPQRSLMLQSFVYMCYLGGGAAVFARLEHWSFLDAIYWADCTMLTVGLGDFSPHTTTGRVLIVPYSWGGIVTIGLVIAGVRGLVIEKGKGKLSLRIFRRGKRLVARAVRKRWAPDIHGSQRGVQAVFECDDRREVGVGELQRRDPDAGDLPIVHDAEGRVEVIERKARWWTQWMGLSAAFVAYLLLWLGGAAVFYASEAEQKWTYWDALYFTNIALLTIGYGDLYPRSQGGKPFFVVWSLLAVPTVTVLISSMQDTILSVLRRAMRWVATKTDGVPHAEGTEEEAKECDPNIENGQFHPDGGMIEGSLDAQDPEEASNR
ncbi:hypothetical protein BDZ91DRAFT_826746 [Kalaharituber pfeilii]|nr:hypothetical protein BDZ91DRAFT_826746 [Kalaharituber pfeilii]